MNLYLKPILRLVIVVHIVTLYFNVLSPVEPVWIRVLATIVLSIPTWIVIARILFPTSRPSPLGLKDEFEDMD